MYRIKVVIVDANAFPIALERITHSRDNTMDMWMQRQVLTPGMQHTNSAAFNTIMGITKATERSPNSRKQQLVIHTPVKQANRVQIVRQGENNVVMLYRKR